MERLALGYRGDLAQGEDWLGCAQVLLRRTPLGTIAYIPRGPALAQPGPEAVARFLRSLREHLESYGLVFLKIEPPWEEATGLEELGFHPSPHRIQMRTTLVLDLTRSSEALLSQMKPKTRYNIGLASRRGITVSRAGTQELPIFYRLLQITAHRDGFPLRSWAYYQRAFACLGDYLQLFLATYEGETLAAIAVVAFGREAVYLYGASSERHRNLMPNHLLQWEAMRWAQERGCQRYDLWGIPDEASTLDAWPEPEQEGKGMWGVYRFKRGFDGQVVRYAGAFDLVFRPARYRLWQRLYPLVQRLRGGWEG